MLPPVLGTERLQLRPFTDDDGPALGRLSAEPSFWWYPWRRALSVAESDAFLARVQQGYRSEHPSLHAVVERESGDLAGYAGLSVPTFLPEVLPAVEVGWRLGRAFRGRGYATEAGGAALRWGFDELGLSEIISIFEPDNVASGRVMDRLGFDAGRPTVDPGHGFDLLVRTLSADDWRAGAGAGAGGGGGRRG